MIGPTNISSSYTTTAQIWEERRKQDALNLTLSTLDQSTLAYQSGIDQEALELNKTTLTTQTQSSTLIGHLENLVKTAQLLSRMAHIVKQEGTGVVTTGVTLSAGLGALWQGNIPWGTSLTLVGLNEVKKMMTKNFTAAGETKDLIGDVKAGLLMIKQLEEYQKSSLETIDQQLGMVSEQLKDIENQQEEIGKMATEGSKDGELKKQEAQKLSQQTANAYRQAFYNLQQSQSTILSSTEKFKSIIEQLKALIEQAQSQQLTSPKSIEEFVKQAQRILTNMQKAQETLNFSQKLFNQGLEELHVASSLNKNAFRKFLEAVTVMEQHFREIQMKAEMTNHLKEAKTHLHKAEEEVKVAKGRSENSKAIADYEIEKAEDLQKTLDDQWGTTSIMVGTGAATLGVAVGGGVISIPIGYGAAAVTHYTRRLYKFAKLLLTTPQPTSTPKKLTKMKITYNPTSTGWGGYTLGLASRILGGEGRSSRTAGTLTLNLGDAQPAIYRFNKNSPSSQGKMDESDMRKLNDNLRQKLKENKLSAQECLDIINSLANVETEHGSICLVASDNLFLRDLKDTCKRQLKK